MSCNGFFELEVTHIHDHQVKVGRYNVPFLGEYEQAVPYAEKVQGEMERAHPGDSFKVRPVLVEDIGPKTSDHIGRLLGALNRSALVIDIVTEKLAQHVAKKALLINPDIPTMMQAILAEAHQRAAQLETAQTALPS